MSKTCIVCGQAAGSGEHVFPASLGGRRTNKGIYCSTHDNGYSSLVADLANQVDVFNAHLGVVLDHSKEVKSVVAKDVATGQDLKLSVKESRFAEPRVMSQQQDGQGVRMDMAFPDRQSMNKWIAEQEAKGLTLTLLHKPEERTYFLDTVHYERRFGGACGLGAVAYVSQTFMAQAFPDMARSEDVAAFIAYTQAIAKVAQLQGGCGEDANRQANPTLVKENQDLARALAAWGGNAPVWWDFEPQPDATPNSFDFGHRVTVGVDALDGQIFGRFSLFSSLHFGMCFGTASMPVATKTVTIDIDPMAEHPPHDIKKMEQASASARVSPPAVSTAGLASAINSSEQVVVFAELIRRLDEHSLAKTAKKMHTELTAHSSLSSSEGYELIRCVVDRQAQRVLNLATWVIRNFKDQLAHPAHAVVGPMLDSLIARDPQSPNGLSAMASATLELAKGALVAQIQQDIKAGRLDERRIAELMGEGPGAAVVGELVLKPVKEAFSR